MCCLLTHLTRFAVGVGHNASTLNMVHGMCSPFFNFFFLVHPSIIAYISIMFVVGARLSWIFMLLGLGWVVVGGFEELGHV